MQISLQNSGGKVIWAPTGVKVPWSLKGGYAHSNMQMFHFKLIDLDL